MTLYASAPCGASGTFYFYDYDRRATRLFADPPTFSLTRAKPSLLVTVTALPDDDATTQTYVMDLYIHGTIANESPRLQVQVVEP